MIVLSGIMMIRVLFNSRMAYSKNYSHKRTHAKDRLKAPFILVRFILVVRILRASVQMLREV
nr:MAG TPA: hypothetical protein [Caudoviricetes sp.]